MAGHEIEKGEVQPMDKTPIERLHDDMRDINSQQDKYFECMEACNPHEQEESCEDVCLPALNDDPDHHPQVELPKTMTSEEDKFHYMDEGELIAELLQITGELGGEMTRQTTINSQGVRTKRIIIEYDIKTKDDKIDDKGSS